MYINKIDELIDKVIDNFYNDNINNNKLFTKLKNDVNFVKYKSDINKIIENYSKNIKVDNIKSLINKQENINKIFNIIKRYIAYYIFLIIGYYYTGKKESYINNVIEYSKSQTDLSFKIDNFFNSENNSAIINYYQLIKDVIYILNLENIKNLNLKKYKTALTFLNQFGKDYVDNNFKGNNSIKAHNLIKTIIFFELYNKQEKKDIFMILEEIEKEDGEFRYIEIVVPQVKTIDFSSIENLISSEQTNKGIASELYIFLNNYIEGKYTEKLLSIDEKIEKLIDNKQIIPIVDDFLRYHKDSEKSDYDRRDTNITKKDTKIKYIITKMDSVSELYSDTNKKNPEKKKKIEQLLYAPLSNRKAVLINDTEEVKIINKLHNQGIRVIRSNEYYSDLINYRIYPYANFKNIQKDGFNYFLKNKTIDLVRYSTFEHLKNNIKSSSNNLLQLRIGSENMNINIVGLMINLSKFPKECQKLSKVTDIRKQKFKFKNNKQDIINGYKSTLSLLKNVYFKKKKINKSLYWLFDLDKDSIKMKTYEEINNVNKNDILKLIISKLYDDLIDNSYFELIKKISNKNIHTYFLLKYLKKYQNKLFKFDKNSRKYNEILAIIMNKNTINVDTGYDYDEDKIPGSKGNLIKIPSIPNKKNNKEIAYIRLTKKKEINKTEKLYMTNEAVCQHNLSWINITLKKRQNSSEFNEDLFAFIEKYVIENKEQDYVCKSCGLLLPIKKFLQDGVYDNSQGKFITFNLPMETPLEEIKEYQKYNKVIKNIDKLVEKICTISDITYYVGSDQSIRLRRKNIVKNVIDMVTLHNNYLKKNNFKQRNEKINEKYGINKNLSSLFFFDLDNSIFTYSSKDTDKYKIIKFNNIIIYIIITLILELNDNQIVNFKNDKFCNFYLFQKIGSKLFNNIKVINNTGLDVKNLTNYSVLSFMIYYFSCMLAKFNIWAYKSEDNQKKSLPLVQMMVIHSFVDTLNSILEVNIDKVSNKNYIYKMFLTKFFIKLDSDYKDDVIINRLENQKDEFKRKTKLESKGVNINEIQKVEISGNMIDYDGKYMDQTFIKLCKNTLFMVSSKKNTRPKLNKLSSITNCEDGKFHKWSVENKELKCSNCSILYSKAKQNQNKENNKIEMNYKKSILGKIADKYCSVGSYHNYSENNICSKCGNKNCSDLPFNELVNINKNIKKIKKNIFEKESKVFNELEESKKNKFNKYNKIIDNINNNFRSNKDFSFIDNFINNIHSVIGKNININNNNIYTKDNIYVINHDRFGSSLKNNIIINEKDNLIQTKLNHSFFNTDVIYYINRKEGNIQIFYDAVTLLYLGYKEPNKEFVLSKNKKNYIQINYSIYNRLIQLGYNSKFINIENNINLLSQYYDINNEEDKIIDNIVSDISRSRINKLKKITLDIHRSLYQLKYGYQIKNSINKINNIIEKYKQKLDKIKIKGDQRIFKHLKAITSEIFYKKSNVINLNTKLKHININDIIKYDNSGNLILFYLVNEMNNLINLNTEKFIKVNIVYFLIDIINYCYNYYNTDSENTNIELQKFNYVLENEILIDKDKIDLDGSIDGIYEEYMDKDELNNDERAEQLYSDNERLDALDIDNKLDDEGYGSDYDYESEQLHAPEYV